MMLVIGAIYMAICVGSFIGSIAHKGSVCRDTSSSDFTYAIEPAGSSGYARERGNFLFW